MSFRFLDFVPAVDRELQLVAPSSKWIDQVVQSCRHPKCAGDERCNSTTRQSLLDFLKIAPDGRQPSDARNRAPAYHFWMHLRSATSPSIPIAGGLNLRIGDSHELRMYFGHIGYAVYPPARGAHLAERSCRLLLPLARAHGMKEIWITCNPENIASRRTCERLGGKLIETVPIPPDNILYERGERKKCRFLISL